MGEIKKVLDSFMNDSGNNFMELFEGYVMKNLENREDYKKFQDLIEDIQLKYPKVQQYLENEQITDMTDEEKEAVLRVMEWYRDIKTIEIKEAFKLGGKEMYIFLEEMDMLSI